MKRVFVLMILLIAFSCREDIRPAYDIYNEWQWVMSTFDTRGLPITSQDVDSTHYLTFTSEGRLIMRNNSKMIVNELDVVFETIDELKVYRINDSEIVFGYGINSDTLVIWQANSIWPQRNIYKITK